MSYDLGYYKDKRFDIQNTINENHNNPKLTRYFGTEKLSKGSLNKYAGQIVLLHKLYFNDKNFTTNWRDYENIESELIANKPLEKTTFVTSRAALIKKIKQMPIEKQRLFYNSLFNYTGHRDYQKLMKDSNKKNIKEINKKMKDNTMLFAKNDKEKENMITEDERDEILNTLRVAKDEAYARIEENGMLNRNADIKPKDFHIIQDYILFMLVSGKYIPIRRSMDWSHMKIDNIDVSTDNYYNQSSKNRALVFNRYKTSKFHGQQIIPFKAFEYNDKNKKAGFYTKEGAKLVQKELDRFIDLIQEYNNSDYLLQDKAGKQMNDVNITHRLNKIFGGRRVSINMLRKSDYSMRGGAIINSKKNYEEEMKKLNFIMKAGGSSISNIQNYVRS
jgi:hypothetical protein